MLTKKFTAKEKQENYAEYNAWVNEIIKHNYRPMFDGTYYYAETPQVIADLNQKTILRNRREKECFPIINRGMLWYGKLSDAQVEQLRIWYQEWLDVTITLVVPTKPIWLE